MMHTECAQGVVGVDPNTQKETLGMLPFLSAAAAILVLADLAKLSKPNFPLNENFIQFSFRTKHSEFVKYQRPPDPCIICTDHDQNTYPAVIKKSKYWKLSS